MSTRKRVVVTGLGVASCFGNDAHKFYDHLVAGDSGVRTITHFPVDEYPTRFAAFIDDFDAEGYVDRKQARRVDPFILYAMVAGKKALEDGNLLADEALGGLDKRRSGIIIGSGMGGMSFFAEGVANLNERGYKRISPFFVPYIITNMAGALLAMDIDFMGPNYSISTACATGNHSIIAAANHIRRGDADLMLAGGTEAAISPIGLSGFCACKALSTRNDAPEKAGRPFDTSRDGFVMGEGAGVLMLESLDHALARGAKIYAEYLGGGVSCDAHHITAPREDGEGIVMCVNMALKDAGVKAEDVSYINAHATSTPLGDRAEIGALKKVFSNPSDIVMNATKALIGHCLGAAGGVEAIAVVKAIETGVIHPTLNFDDPEPNIEFQLSIKKILQGIKIAISNSFGFGGHNATLVFAPYKR